MGKLKKRKDRMKRASKALFCDFASNSYHFLEERNALIMNPSGKH
jgi:hypothetical protein